EASRGRAREVPRRRREDRQAHEEGRAGREGREEAEALRRRGCEGREAPQALGRGQGRRREAAEARRRGEGRWRRRGEGRRGRGRQEGRRMIGRLVNIFRVPDLRQRLWITLLFLVVYRVGMNIPLPGVNMPYLKEILERNEQGGDFLSLINMLS